MMPYVRNEIIESCLFGLFNRQDSLLDKELLNLCNEAQYIIRPVCLSLTYEGEVYTPNLYKKAYGLKSDAVPEKTLPDFLVWLEKYKEHQRTKDRITQCFIMLSLDSSTNQEYRDNLPEAVIEFTPEYFRKLPRLNPEGYLLAPSLQSYFNKLVDTIHYTQAMQLIE